MYPAVRSATDPQGKLPVHWLHAHAVATLDCGVQHRSGYAPFTQAVFKFYGGGKPRHEIPLRGGVLMVYGNGCVSLVYPERCRDHRSPKGLRGGNFNVTKSRYGRIRLFLFSVDSKQGSSRKKCQ